MHEISKKSEKYLHNPKNVRTFALAFEKHFSKQQNKTHSVRY